MRIDAVVAWVDGSDPVHQAKRSHWLKRSQGGARIIRKATISHRFADNNEIVYCLRSIRNHAPWIDTIWLVTDDQVPAGIDPALAAEMKLRIVDHKHLFRGIENVLPTFNSMAIESALHRIKGLAEHFIYFNDDMFLANPIGKASFFGGPRGREIVLRGAPVDWSIVPRNHHRKAQRRSAAMLGGDPLFGFAEAHMPHPLLRSVLLGLSQRFAAEYAENMALRFRTNTRFAPITLHNYELMAAGRTRMRARKRTTHISVGKCENGTSDLLARELAKAASTKTLMFCINAFGDMLDKLPDAEERLAAIVGPALPWETGAALPSAAA